VPVLLVVGDEDEPCLDGNLFMKRTIPGAGLLVLPNTGHAIHRGEPAAFHAAVAEFFALVEQGRWPRLRRHGPPGETSGRRQESPAVPRRRGRGARSGGGPK
jgi:hypothetical protein